MVMNSVIEGRPKTGIACACRIFFLRTSGTSDRQPRFAPPGLEGYRWDQDRGLRPWAIHFRRFAATSRAFFITLAMLTGAPC